MDREMAPLERTVVAPVARVIVTAPDWRIPRRP
jgi:hypothetical protein